MALSGLLSGTVLFPARQHPPAAGLCLCPARLPPPNALPVFLRIAAIRLLCDGPASPRQASVQTPCWSSAIFSSAIASTAAASGPSPDPGDDVVHEPGQLQAAGFGFAQPPLAHVIDRIVVHLSHRRPVAAPDVVGIYFKPGRSDHPRPVAHRAGCGFC